MDDTASIDRNSCSLTEQEAAARREEVHDSLTDSYRGAEANAGTVTVDFEGVEQPLPALASFIEQERDCCAFATYRILVEPPYEETKLVVDGPEGTAELFREELSEVFEPERSDAGTETH